MLDTKVITTVRKITGKISHPNKCVAFYLKILKQYTRLKMKSHLKSRLEKRFRTCKNRQLHRRSTTTRAKRTKSRPTLLTQTMTTSLTNCTNAHLKARILRFPTFRFSNRTRPHNISSPKQCSKTRIRSLM